MGLAIVHGIVHEHGGHVVARIGPGRGCAFSRPATGGDAGGGGAVWFTGWRDLLVALEDAALVGNRPRGRRRGDRRTIHVRIADELGGEAECCIRGDAAVAAVRANPSRFDAVITDQAMPRMSGLELARHLYAVRPDLPVIVHTGNVDAMPALGAAGVRPCAVLQKPVDPAQLRSVLAQCLEATGAGSAT